MTKKGFRTEANKFVHELASLSQFYHVNDDDFVWDQITKDAREYVVQHDYFPPQRPNQCHFMQSERPDVIYECDDFVMGIECFEFDASLKTRKGSTQKQKEIQTDRRILEIHKSKDHEISENDEICKPVDVNFSLEYYKDALLDGFRSHANSIGVYRENIAHKFPNKKAYLSFYIEDTTALGNYIISSRGNEAIVPLCVKEFIDELSKIEGLDYVITNTQNFYIHSLHIQAINDYFLKSLYKQSYDLTYSFYWKYKYQTKAHFYHLTSDEGE